jgi:hypothetical protein
MYTIPKKLYISGSTKELITGKGKEGKEFPLSLTGFTGFKLNGKASRDRFSVYIDGAVIPLWTQDFLNLVNNVTIVNGVIQDRCLIAKENGNIKIIPFNQEEKINEAIVDDTQDKYPSYTYKNLKPGDIFTSLSEREYVYFGEFKRVSLSRLKRNNEEQPVITINKDKLLAIKSHYDKPEIDSSYGPFSLYRKEEKIKSIIGQVLDFDDKFKMYKDYENKEFYRFPSYDTIYSNKSIYKINRPEFIPNNVSELKIKVYKPKTEAVYYDNYHGWRMKPNKESYGNGVDLVNNYIDISDKLKSETISLNKKEYILKDLFLNEQVFLEANEYQKIIIKLYY